MILGDTEEAYQVGCTAGGEFLNRASAQRKSSLNGLLVEL